MITTTYYKHGSTACSHLSRSIVAKTTRRIMTKCLSCGETMILKRTQRRNSEPRDDAQDLPALIND